MPDRDVSTDRIRAGIAVLEQQLATGPLNVAHQKWSGVDAALLVHEVDAAVAIHNQHTRP
jgi:hypothetical protein